MGEHYRLPEKEKLTGFYISDVHFLISKKVRPHAHKELLQLLDQLILRKVRFKNIYLVGDVIENWFFSAANQVKRRKRRLARLFDRLDALATPKSRKYYIIGNHDTVRFSMRLEPSLARFLDRRHWIISERVRKKKLVVLHGHQGQYNRLTWALDIAIVRSLYFLSFAFPALLKKAESFYDRHLNRRDPGTALENLTYYQRLSQVADQGKRIMVSGHTHRALCLPELRVINTGDWVQSRTFVLQSGQRFRLLKALGRKKYQLLADHTF
ncbi:MAG: metallophosphoesterase family protein [Spirochaetales bacterium]|nr:metallophosphoesterase family protein [Spirochaetales bacterium]